MVKQHRFHRFVFCFKHFAQLSNIFDLMRTKLGLNLLSMIATTCGSLLHELQVFFPSSFDYGFVLPFLGLQ